MSFLITSDLTLGISSVARRRNLPAQDRRSRGGAKRLFLPGHLHSGRIDGTLG